MRVRRGFLLTVLVVAWTAALAQAQWVATPYLGTNFGDAEVKKGGPGVAVGYLGRRLGFELDFARHYHFFKDGDVANIVPGPSIDLDTDAMSFMGNVVAPLHSPGAKKWRPYATAGLGVIYASFDSADDRYDTHQTNLAFNLGGGVVYWLNDRVGLQGDMRYFHAFVDENKRTGGYFKDYDLGRVSLGVTFRFAR